MQSKKTSSKSPLFQLFLKFVDCLVLVTAIYNSYNILFIQPFPTLPWIFGLLNPLMSISGVLFCFIYPFIWQRKENEGTIDSNKLQAWIRGILRYWLAACICTYGFAKVFGTQFEHFYAISDSLVKDLSGFDLTWNYFGFSYGMTLIIALVQIGGSVLLLFRRTTLLGVAILFPVMFNILLINLFYNIKLYAFLNSILYTLGLLYLLLLRWEDIKAILFQQSHTIQPIRLGFVKHIIRILVILYPFGLIYYFTINDKPNILVGKWQVDHYIRNHDTLNVNAWLTDSTAWNKIYIEESEEITLSANPYVIEKNKSTRGKYKYDSAYHTLILILTQGSPKKDTLLIKVNFINNKQMNWALLSKNDSLLLQLSKVEDNNKLHI